MQYYLAERYLAGHDHDAVAADAVRVRAVTERVGGGERLRFLQTVYVPGDELCFYLFEGRSSDLIDTVSRDACIDFERILPAVAVFDGRTDEPQHEEGKPNAPTAD